MAKLKGMTASIYKSEYIGDCTNRGISSKCNSMLLVGEGIPQIMVSGKKPTVKLVKRIINGVEYLHVEPIGKAAGAGWMMGGNYLYSCDSRFPSKYPIPIHDRQEFSDNSPFARRQRKYDNLVRTAALLAKNNRFNSDAVKSYLENKKKVINNGDYM